MIALANEILCSLVSKDFSLIFDFGNVPGRTELRDKEGTVVLPTTDESEREKERETKSTGLEELERIFEILLRCKPEGRWTLREEPRTLPMGKWEISQTGL